MKFATISTVQNEYKTDLLKKGFYPLPYADLLDEEFA
jgi:hypothetical protein